MKKLYKISLMLTVLALSVPAMVQASGPGFNGNVNDGGGMDCPIDGGLSLLAAAGVGYGIKKFRDKKKSEEAEAEVK